MWGLETLKIEFNRSYLGFFFQLILCVISWLLIDLLESVFSCDTQSWIKPKHG